MVLHLHLEDTERAETPLKEIAEKFSCASVERKGNIIVLDCGATAMPISPRKLAEDITGICRVDWICK